MVIVVPLCFYARCGFSCREECNHFFWVVIGWFVRLMGCVRFMLVSLIVNSVCSRVKLFILTLRLKFGLAGYPYNLDFDYGALVQLQHFSINNLGDPFIESNYGVHSRQFEVGVLDWFARLWEIEKNDYWGYITNCGTEGNLHGILVG